MARKKMYLVKKEVIATSLEKALHKQGTIYEVVLADEKSWPELKSTKIGLKKK